MRHRHARRGGRLGRALLLFVLLAAASPARGQCELERPVPTDGAEFIEFGRSVGISGHAAIVGAPASPIGAPQAGSAYIMRFDGSTWAEEIKLQASDGSPSDFFGDAVGIDGDVAIVGAPGLLGFDLGAGYIYRKIGTAWVETKLTLMPGETGTRFGDSVAISGDVAIVGFSRDDDAGPFSGSAYVYRYNGSDWVGTKLTASDAASGDQFGGSVAVSGDVVIVGADNHTHLGVRTGSAYVYRYDGSTWLETELVPSDGADVDSFGFSVAIDGDVVIVGARLNDDDGAQSGSAYVFRYDGSDWVEETNLHASDAAANDQFGWSVAVDGNAAIVGAWLADEAGNNSGAAYLFRYDGSMWVETKVSASDIAADDQYGFSVAVRGDLAILGARLDDDDGQDAGAAYVFAVLTGRYCCPGDAGGDGVVGIVDFLSILAAWGPCPRCPEDLNDDGVVDILDFLDVLAKWDSPCYTTATDLVGLPLTAYPFINFVRTATSDQTLSVAIDPHRYSHILDQTASVWVVQPKTAVQWDMDPTLTDVRGAPQAVSFAGPDIQDATIALTGTLSGDGGLVFGVGYDLVVDMDLDGKLGGGDFIDGYGDEPGFHVVGDTTVVGPLPLTLITYTIGPLEQRTVYPTALTGVYPLVVISHGRGHMHDWYDYLQVHLASYGYIVMSHVNDTITIPSAAASTLANTESVIANQAALGLGGHIDSSRIVWIGHSRGGEGVVHAYDLIRDGTYTPTGFTASDIVLISSIAPTSALGTGDTDPHDVNYHLIYGSADGDITGEPADDGVQSFQLPERATGYRATTYVHGADHNDFNCCGSNDFCDFAPCSPLLEIGQPETQLVAKATYLALVKHFVEGSVPAKDFLWRQYENLKPIGVDPGTIVVNDYRDGPASANFVLDDFQSQPSTAVSSSGGAVSFDVSGLSEALSDDNDALFTSLPADPMNGMTRATPTDFTRSVVFEWDSDTFIEFEVIVAERDFSDDTNLSFRACQATRHPNTVAVLGDLTFDVILRDSAGQTSSINIGAYGGGVEEPFARMGFGAGTGWQNEFETIRIRLTDFGTNDSGLNLSDVVALRFEFGPGHGSAEGRISLDDIEITTD